MPANARRSNKIAGIAELPTCRRQLSCAIILVEAESALPRAVNACQEAKILSLIIGWHTSGPNISPTGLTIPTPTPRQIREANRDSQLLANAEPMDAAKVKMPPRNSAPRLPTANSVNGSHSHVPGGGSEVRCTVDYAINQEASFGCCWILSIEVKELGRPGLIGAHER